MLMWLWMWIYTDFHFKSANSEFYRLRSFHFFIFIRSSSVSSTFSKNEEKWKKKNKHSIQTKRFGLALTFLFTYFHSMLSFSAFKCCICKYKAHNKSQIIWEDFPIFWKPIFGFNGKPSELMSYIAKYFFSVIEMMQITYILYRNGMIAITSDSFSLFVVVIVVFSIPTLFYIDDFFSLYFFFLINKMKAENGEWTPKSVEYILSHNVFNNRFVVCCLQALKA